MCVETHDSYGEVQCSNWSIALPSRKLTIPVSLFLIDARLVLNSCNPLSSVGREAGVASGMQRECVSCGVCCDTCGRVVSLFHRGPGNHDPRAKAISMVPKSCDDMVSRALSWSYSMYAV